MYIIIIIYSWKLLSNARVHFTRERWEKYKYIHTSSIRIHSTIWIWIWIGIWNCASITKAFFLFIIAFYCIHYDKRGDSQVDVFSFIDIIKFLFFAFCFVLFLELTYRLTAFSLNEDLDSSLALKTATPAHLLDCPQPPTTHQAEYPSPFLNLSLFVLAELPLSLPLSPLSTPRPTSKGSP